MKFSIHKKDFLPHLSSSIDLDLFPGEILLLKGENGIGKTSLAREVFAQSAGAISFIRQEGMDIFYDRSLGKLKRIFLQSSQDLLHEDMFHDFWSKFGLGNREDRMLSSLSGGEEQMLKLCLGLFLNKTILILDEPSQNLDDDMKKILARAVSELTKIKKAILIIEHESQWIESSFKAITVKADAHVLRVVGT